MDPLAPDDFGEPAMRFKWIRRRECWTLTWPARMIILIVALAALRGSAPYMYLWLACGERMPSTAPSAVVIEGWINDAVLEETRPWLISHPDVTVYCTGGPVEYGSPLLSFASYAEVTRLRVIAAGVDTGRVHAVASDYVARDRTWASALAVREVLKNSKQDGPVTLWLVSQGTHSRRSRLLFDRALRGYATVDIWGLKPDRYGRNDWWTLSEGFKAVTGEMTALPYTWLQRQSAEDEPAAHPY